MEKKRKERKEKGIRFRRRKLAAVVVFRSFDSAYARGISSRRKPHLFHLSLEYRHALLNLRVKQRYERDAREKKKKKKKKTFNCGFRKPPRAAVVEGGRNDFFRSLDDAPFFLNLLL